MSTKNSKQLKKDYFKFFSQKVLLDAQEFIFVPPLLANHLN